MTKIFSKIGGIGFGSFSSDICTNEWKDLLKKLVMERLKEFNFPILFDLPIGHISGNACIPLGYQATLNGDDGILSIHIPHV
jgi:muramoyltetrapeptide carboxypeptidase